VSNLRGFLPASQVDFGFSANLEQYVGQKLRVKVTEVNPAKKNLVVSRRAFLEIARAEEREEAWKRIEIGQRFVGTVKTIKDYGAFVDIGGVDGLLHVGEMSWSRIAHPKDLLQEGQQVEVQIIGIDREKSKISLGMRQLVSNPWQDIAEKYATGNNVHGTVTKTTDFGAFVELEPGVEGMIHISELDHRRVHRVTDILQVGKEVDVQVLSVDPDKKRIALSLKALVAKPEREAKKSDEDLSPGGGAAYERKRKGPLKGGGTGSGGLLFGDPGLVE
jgi:small subunit ribosomal protein S1